jgi:hypothetical protein
VVWLRPRPRDILDLDHLMRIVNRRTKGVLLPVKLLQKMRDMLMRDKEREDEGSWVKATRAAPICALDLFPKG